MGPLLPFLVDWFLLFAFFLLHLFGNFLSCLISLLRHNSSISINFLELILFLLRVPFHDSLSFYILYCLFIWDHIHSDIFQKVFLTYTPKRRVSNLVFAGDNFFLLYEVFTIFEVCYLWSLLFLVINSISLYLTHDCFFLFLGKWSVILYLIDFSSSLFTHLNLLNHTLLLQLLIIL